MNTSGETTTKQPRTLLISFAILGTIILVWLIYGIIIYLMLPNWTSRGTFGDMFGAVNALFSGLALAGIVVAIILQRHELELQRREL